MESKIGNSPQERDQFIKRYRMEEKADIENEINTNHGQENVFGWSEEEIKQEGCRKPF